ncbi:hypothetical protein HYDPIDRAFT_112500 [Hydnomerulius pinastri MD-312]|uniref:F-box domain-containing protein n=1 Tax=Hydnomerulius pinastri MD-312 TaxID=994086 RepID=A0A0C9WEK0_9AGAM|nr:hypothetical protein HYDPIDRAFT_112500 [Hydnomerulius pinastri MD-312]
MTRPTTETVDQEITVLLAQLSVLQRREDDFARVLDDMARLQDSIRAERVALSSKITELESQKHPINWLPSELLIQIFLVCAEDESAEIAAGLSYNPASVLISHVCRKWRELALTTSALWSFISYRDRQWRTQPLFTFLERSGQSPITFTFVTPPSSLSGQDVSMLEVAERMTSTKIVEVLMPRLPRVRSITFECSFPRGMAWLLGAINHSEELHKLESLDLALSAHDPSFEGTTLLTADQLSREDPPGVTSALTYLRLQQLPPTAIPGYLVRTVQTLELSYPLRKTPTVRRHHFVLRMSHLISLLRHTPQLHELSMIGVTPLWDVITKAQTNPSPSQTASEPLKLISAFELPKVKRLEWKYAYPRDVFPFLSLVALPELEHWDLLIAQSPTKRYDLTQFRGNHIHDQDSFIQAEPLANVQTLHSVKELNVSCQNEDTLGSALRQFLFPSLEKLDIAFVGQHLRKEPGLPMLSRLESIFRDPRLPLLTHLTISHFDIFIGYGKTMLGYMPNLRSLTLGACTGVSVILEALAESYGTPGQGPRGRRCGVRVCPRLEELVLWSCTDFDFGALVSAVYARGILLNSGGEPNQEPEAVASAVLGRKIRPLKKTRNVGASQTQRADTNAHAVSGSRSTLIPIEEALHPSCITCVHLEDCPQISEEQAYSLEEVLGTVVMYR